MALHLTKKVFDPDVPLPDGRSLPTYMMRVEVTVDNGDLMPAAIFVWRAYSLMQADAGDVCQSVASLSNISAYPVNAPQRDPSNMEAVPFYRLAYAEFHCETEADIEEVWAGIQEDVRDLCANWIASRNLSMVDEIVDIATE